jgi:hypothetical protein
MSIIRGVKDRRFKFVQLLNSMFEDPKLSLKAKGFIGFCLTKKQDWDFHISHLCKVLKEGEDAIYSTVKECIEHGYAYRYRTRDAKGQLTEVEYLICDSKEEVTALKKERDASNEFNKLVPQRENPGVDNPRRENPGVDFPGEIVPIYSNTDNSNTREQQQQQNAAVSSKFEYLKKQQAEYNKGKQSNENIVQPEKPPIYGNLSKIDIPEADKIEITNRYSELIVYNAIVWATHPTTKLIKGLAPAIKWACIHQPKVNEVKKEKEKLPIDYACYNRGYFCEIRKVSHKNGHILDSYGLREATNDYLETEHDKIYYKDVGFLEQVANFIRKKSIECKNIYDMIKVCQQDLSRQT